MMKIVQALTRSGAIRALAVIALPGLLFVIYWFGVRPHLLRWGATPAEVARSMPGDDLVYNPTFYATRGITIRGKPEAIWPWLAQMGYDRAGFYGYDLIENLGSASGIRSAGTILPELQDPKTGETLPISKVAHMVFGEIRPGEFLIWQGDAKPADAAFTWALYPIDENHTRLVSRIRMRYHWTDQRIVLDLFTEFADHVAVPKILEGIKDRVEAGVPEPIAVQAVEMAIWLLAITEWGAGMWFVLRWPRWGRAWLAALGSGLVVLFVLYVHAPVWTGTALTLFWGIGLVFMRKAYSGTRVDVSRNRCV